MVKASKSATTDQWDRWPTSQRWCRFKKQWQRYRTVVDYNYLFHREAYSCLHRALIEEAVRPFRFLDVACGDASATVEAPKGPQIASYHGIDLSQVALELASQALETLACTVTLDRGDFVEALREPPAFSTVK